MLCASVKKCRRAARSKNMTWNLSEMFRPWLEKELRCVEEELCVMVAATDTAATGVAPAPAADTDSDSEAEADVVADADADYEVSEKNEISA